MGVAVVFPGQGTQEPGMGAPWRDHAAWAVVERAEHVLGEPLGHLLLDADAETLNRTRNAQLAVLLTSLVAWEALAPCGGLPVAFAGHSLGQVTALIASGALPFDAGLGFAARRAELTQAATDATPGRMAALLGATLEQAEAACAAAPGACWIANDNAPGQVVVGGTPEGVDRAAEQARALGVKRVTSLKVGGAFHTPLMRAASEALVGVLRAVDFSTPSSPVVSNHDAVAYVDADGWRGRSAEHVAVPVRWRETMATLETAGAQVFLEVGHGSMLAALAKRGTPGVTVVNVAAPHDIPTTLEVN